MAPVLRQYTHAVCVSEGERMGDRVSPLVVESRAHTKISPTHTSLTGCQPNSTCPNLSRYNALFSTTVNMTIVQHPITGGVEGTVSGDA